jgi:predicted metal-dependent peptidase
VKVTDGHGHGHEQRKRAVLWFLIFFLPSERNEERKMKEEKKREREKG